jgi:DNA-binding response OmpR family regulator
MIVLKCDTSALEAIMETVQTAQKKILVCDDDADILDVISSLLKLEGYAVTTATAHDEFFAKFRHCKPDLIILDVRMPEHDGFWIADELQILKNKAPIIFVSAHNRSVYRLCAPIAGAVDFIVKPFDPPDLIERVRSVLKLTDGSASWFLYATCHQPANSDQSTE